MSCEYPDAERCQIPGESQWEEYSHAKMLTAEVLFSAEATDAETRARPECWYRLLYEHLVRTEKAVWPRIVTFNYDRSLEYWLSWYRARDAGCPPKEARSWCASLQSHHVYQQLAKLPDGQTQDGFSPEYGKWEIGCNGVSPFWKARENLVMLGDARAKNQEYSNCQQWLREADRLIILGFGYDELNCQRIGLDQSMGSKKVFSTAFGRNDAAFISKRLKPCGPILGMQGESCYDFLCRQKLLEI